MASRRKAPDQIGYGEIDNPTHEGWLLKEDKADWKKRFVVLKEKKMYCYQERKEGSLPKGVIDINGFMIELVDDQDLVEKLIQSDELAIFQLMHPFNPEEFPGSRFCASNEKNLQEWFNSILLEFCREYVRRSTYVDLAALDEDVPDFAAFQAKKKLAQIAEAANEEHNYYHELELDEEDYDKFQQQRDSGILEEKTQKRTSAAATPKKEPEKVVEVKHEDLPAATQPLASPRGNQQPPSSPRGTQQPQQQPEPSKQQKRTTKVLQNASAWGQSADDDVKSGPKDSKKSSVAEEIERERQRLRDEEGKQKVSDDQKQREEQAAAKKEEAAKKAREEEAAVTAAATQKRKAEEEAAQKRKTEEEAASKKRADDDAAAKKKKAEEDAAAKKRKADEDAALQRKNKEEEELKKAAEEAAKKKNREEEEERKKKDNVGKLKPAASFTAPAEAPQTPAQKKEARKTVAQLEIEQERERQKKEEDKRVSKVPDLPPRQTQTPPTLQSATAAFGGSAKRVSAVAPVAAAPAPTPVPAQAPTTTTTAAPALPAKTERDSQQQQKPFTSMEHNRITVVTARPKVNTSVAAGGAAAPQRLFSGKHATLKEAAIDWVNSRLGQDSSLQSRGLVPVSSANLASKCKDGVLLCKLVNTAVSKTLDDRAINYDGLNDQSNVKENFSLCLNSGRAIGCSFTVQPDTLLKGNEDDFVSTIAQFIVVYLRSRLKIMYDGDDVNLRCGACSSTVDSQYAMKGSSPYCINCISKPLTLINLFCGEGGMSSTPITSSPQVRSQAQTQSLLQAQVVDAKTQPDFLEVSKQLDSIGDRFSKLTDKDIVDGKGSQLLTDMKALMAKLQAISVKYPMESYALVQKYNSLTKEIPERINKGYKNAGDNQVVVTSSGQKCFKCQKNLTGQTVEVFGNTYHHDCFGCFECGKSLGKSCLNVDNKPYCERCGKKAFIQSRLRK